MGFSEEHGPKRAGHSRTRSAGDAALGGNAYNQGQEPEDWWGQIKRMHGHVGPWNVLGWRVGKAALREFDTKWGWHELDIICYVPIKTPYSCMADGLVIGTGNTRPVLIFRPKHSYLSHIDAPKPEELEKLSRKCSEMEESSLFEIERIG